jgi:EmrB/QacA subfamily drug resistance transporter
MANRIQSPLILEPTQAHPTKPRLGLVLAIVVTCQMMLILDTTVMNIALPAIQTDLHFSRTGLSWVIDGYVLAYGGLLLVGGRAGDILGRRQVFVAGVAVFTLASLAGGLATSPAELVGARVGQGVAAAVAGPNALALLTATFTEPRARIRALALFSAVASGGLAIGLVVGGALTEWGSWRWVLFVNVPFGAAVCALAPRFVPAPPRHSNSLDLPGGAAATAGFAGLVYALIRAADRGWGDGVTIGTLAASAVLIGAFLAIEARTARPLVPLRLFADRNRAGGYLIMMLTPAAMLAMFFFLTQFLQDVRGLSPLRAGLAFLPMALIMFGGTRLIPLLLPRFGPRRLAVTGMLLITAGLIWLSQISVHSGYATAVLGPIVLFGAGGALGVSPLNPVIMAGVRPQDVGAAAGVLQTAQQVGSGLGLAVLVTVFGAATRAATGHPAAAVLAHGSAVAFAVATAFTATGALVGLTLRTDH